MSYQAIAFDLDGTLLNSQGKILASSQAAIQQARNQGVKVILVTGRHHTAVIPYYTELALDTPIICCNGTYIYDPKTDETPIANPFTKEKAETIIALAEQHHLHLLMYSRDAMNYQSLNPHLEKFTQWANSYPENIRPQVQQISDYRQFLSQGELIWKFVISHPDKQLLNNILAKLPENQFSCEWSWIDRVDISNYGNSKGSCLLKLLNHWNIDPQNVIAFGDNYNDLSMLNAVGLGVAMGNADEEIKQQAKLVTQSNNEESIAQVLTQYLSQ